MPERGLHETVHLGEHRGREDVVENRRMVGDDDRSPEGAHLCEGLALNRHDGKAVHRARKEVEAPRDHRAGLEAARHGISDREPQIGKVRHREAQAPESEDHPAEPRLETAPLEGEPAFGAFGLFLRHGGLHHARSHSKRVAAPDVTNADLSDARPAASWREAGSTGSACFRERGVIVTPAPFFRSQAVA